MSDAAARSWVVAVVLATAALEAAAVVLAVGQAGLGQAVPYAITAVVQATCGAAIVWRHTWHRIGWLLALLALSNALVADAALAYGRRASAEGWAFGPYAELAGLLSWIVACLGLVLLFLLFPDGRLSAPGWRWALVAWLLGAVLAVPGWGLNPRLGSQLSAGVNPLATDALPVEPMYVLGAALLSGSLVSAVVALLLRFRRSHGTQRQQLKWVLLAGSALAVVLPLSAALWTVWPPIQYAAALALLLLPLSMSVAILRHDLYDIDVVLSRTFSYVVLSGMLVATYTAVVLAVGSLLASPVAAAAAALAVAVAFAPLRRRVQGAVDRRFRRSRYESRQLMTDFVDRLRRGDVDADAVEQALRSAVHDEELVIGFRTPAGTTYDVSGRPRAIDQVAGRRTTLVETGPQVLAVVRHRTGDARSVAEVVDAGRLALEIAALQVELRRRLEELDASRARLVVVADDERRRLARDLHDGAQQRLVSVGLGLRHVQHALNGHAPPDVDRTLDRAVAELGNAIDELRELAGGLRPASLDEGLAVALRELAVRSPIPVVLHTTAERFGSTIETAAYFIACEGLTNAVKHAAAQRVSFGVERDNGHLVLTVNDDGAGGADTHRGTGLRGLVDRARAHGGTLTVESPPGYGTCLTARLPCA